MPQQPLSQEQIATLQSHGPLVGNRRHILEQLLFPNEVPYYIWLVIHGCRASYKHEVVRQLKDSGRLPYQVVEEVVCDKSFKLSTMRHCLKCALVRPEEFGLAPNCPLSDLITAANKRHLEYLPTDAALFAALQFADKWTTDKLVVFISEPVEHQGQEFLFALENRVVNAIATEDCQLCHPEHSYLFARKP